MNRDDLVLEFLEKEFHGVHRHIDYAINLVSERLEQRMSDLSSQVDQDTSALSTDIDQMAAKLDAAQADQLTQAEADAIHALRTKADALLSASPVVPTQAASGGDVSSSGDQAATDTGSTDASAAGNATSVPSDTPPTGTGPTGDNTPGAQSSVGEPVATNETTDQPSA